MYMESECYYAGLKECKQMKDERLILQKQIEKFEYAIEEMGNDIELITNRIDEHKVLIRALKYRLNKLLED